MQITHTGDNSPHRLGRASPNALRKAFKWSQPSAGSNEPRRKLHSMPLFAALAVLTGFGPYTDLSIEGWTVRVETAEISDSTWPVVKTELSTQLYRISHVVGDEPLSKLRRITIWVHTNDRATPCMAYHPEAPWLKEHGSNPEMVHGVELANAKNFISWTYEQPWMLLHELAHGFHHQFLTDGFENKEVKSVWDAEFY
jgi:hypothetical protein